MITAEQTETTLTVMDRVSALVCAHDLPVSTVHVIAPRPGAKTVGPSLSLTDLVDKLPTVEISIPPEHLAVWTAVLGMTSARVHRTRTTNVHLRTDYDGITWSLNTYLHERIPTRCVEWDKPKSAHGTTTVGALVALIEEAS